jgi:hypothetical protein
MKKIIAKKSAAKAAPVVATAVQTAKPEKSKSAAQVNGTVLKRAFPDQNAEGLKLIRRHLRKALRNKEAPQFRFHKIGTRWVFPSARDVATARATVKPYLAS